MLPFCRPAPIVAPCIQNEDTDPLRRYLPAIAGGDQEALNALYRTTHRRIEQQVLRILENRQDAEEVVADTYWQVWRTAGTFCGTRGTVHSWLSMIARTRALDRLRVRNSRDRVEVGGSSGQEGGAEDRFSQPDEQIHGSRQKLALREALNTLPAEIRTLVALAFFEEMSHARIALSVGQPLGTVKTKIRRGLQLLGPALAPYRGGPAAGGRKVSERLRKAKV